MLKKNEKFQNYRIELEISKQSAFVYRKHIFTFIVSQIHKIKLRAFFILYIFKISN